MNRRVQRAAHWALAAAHQQIGRARQLIPELALALFDDPALEHAALVAHYGAGTGYLSKENQDLGLYPFEARALGAYFPSPPARLLLPGAGAGRELFALTARGYDVDAFDASPVLAAAARRRGGSRADVRHEDLATWARAVTQPRAVGDGDGCSTPRYDGIFTGWVFWTHLVRRRERLRALDAFRRVCPSGPVLLSFWRREKIFDLEEEVFEPESNARWRLALRALRERALGHAPLEEGTSWTDGMFVHLVSRPEIEREAQASGYRLVHYESNGSRFPNAVLLPCDAPLGDGRQNNRAP